MPDSQTDASIAARKRHVTLPEHLSRGVPVPPTQSAGNKQACSDQGNNARLRQIDRPAGNGPIDFTRKQVGLRMTGIAAHPDAPAATTEAYGQLKIMQAPITTLEAVCVEQVFPYSRSNIRVQQRGRATPYACVIERTAQGRQGHLAVAPRAECEAQQERAAGYAAGAAISRGSGAIVPAPWAGYAAQESRRVIVGNVEVRSASIGISLRSSGVYNDHSIHQMVEEGRDMGTCSNGIAVKRHAIGLDGSHP